MNFSDGSISILAQTKGLLFKITASLDAYEPIPKSDSWLPSTSKSCLVKLIPNPFKLELISEALITLSLCSVEKIQLLSLSNSI